MQRESLIEQCRYYKGEDKNPFDGVEQNKAMLWFYELKWVEFNFTDPTLLIEYVEDYNRAGLSGFNSADGVPITLKALLHNRYEKWNEGPGFEKFYLKYYAN